MHKPIIIKIIKITDQIVRLDLDLANEWGVTTEF